MESPVTFSSSGLTLYGMLGMPTQREPGGRGVILLHGWAGYRIGPHRLLVHAARRLINCGFCTLRFDHRGRGDSEGSGEEACLDDMIEDAQTAIEFLKAQAFPESVTLLGICSGANVAIGAATLRPDVKELVLWSILPFQPEHQPARQFCRAQLRAREYFRKALYAETWRRLFRGEIHVCGVGRAVMGDRKPGRGERNLKDSDRDIMAAFGRYRGRALFVTGSLDPEGMDGRELFVEFCRMKGIHADFYLMEDAIHSFCALSHERELVDVTVDWLQARPRNADE